MASPSCSCDLPPWDAATSVVDSLGRRRLLDLLGRLIGIRTVNPPGEGYGEMAEALQEILEDIGFEVEVREVPRSALEQFIPQYADHPRYIVIARLGSGRPILHFNSHYDVVPPGQGWSVEPFKATVGADGDTVYGRGAVDMKGGLATALLAAEAANVAGAVSRGTLELSFTPDEETGGETGVKYMLDSGMVSPDYAIVPEASGAGNIWIGNKGTLWAEVEVYGRQAHGSTPWLGLNAFEGMVELAGALMRSLKPRLESRRSSFNFSDPREASPTLNMGGQVSGGAKVNVVPGYYSFTVDRRLIPEESSAEAEAELREALREASAALEAMGYRVDLKVISRSEPSAAPPDGRLARELSRAVREVTGSQPSLTICPGGLDTRYFQQRGIEALTYGPGDSSYAHAADERNSIGEMLTVAKAYARAIAYMLS